MSPSSHHATFTWGPGPQSVFVAGGFNDWSDHATPLQKQADGSFAAEVPLPYGQKQAFKYVVDGEWKVREDEAKEWDAAGNMNNVYTAPPAPVEPESHAAPAAAAAAASHEEKAPVTESAVPATTEKKEEPRDLVAPSSTSESKTAAEPASLLAASAPSAASAGFVLGAPVTGSGSRASDATGVSAGTGSFNPVSLTTSTTALPSSEAAAPVPVVVAPTTATTTTTTAPAPVTEVKPETATIQKVAAEPMPEKLEKTAANANIGDASAAGQEGVLEKVAEVGGTMLATLGAAIGTAAVAVERATGVDIIHSPLSVEEAKARGIDVNNLEKVDAPTDAISPVGQKPSSAAVADLDEKLKDLKMDSAIASASTGLSSTTGVNAASPNAKQVAVPLPGASTSGSGNDKSNDIPAQADTKDNHSVVPQPHITTLSEKDPKKDRTADSGTAAPATVHTQPVSKDPAVDPKKAKEQGEARSVPREQSSSASPDAILPPGQSTAAPDQKANNIGAGTTSSSAAAGKSTSTPAAPKPVEKDVFSSGSLPAASAGTTNTTTAPHSPSPATVAPPAAASAAAPAPPAKTSVNGTGSAAAAPAVAVTPSSVASTPAGTPAKSAHARDSTYGSSASGDVKKRKSGFFHKIKTAFSPKDKEKK